MKIMNLILLLKSMRDSKMNLSSFDVVRKLKKIFSLNKVGHAGTLDPLATGILPIAFGNATKTIPYLVSSKKKYRFTSYSSI